MKANGPLIGMAIVGWFCLSIITYVLVRVAWERDAGGAIAASIATALFGLMMWLVVKAGVVD